MTPEPNMNEALTPPAHAEPSVTNDQIDEVWLSGDWYRPGLIANDHAQDFARAVIAADRAQRPAAPDAVMQQAVPDGWKLVPIEPTEDMWTAGRHPVMHRDLCHKPSIYPSYPEPVCAWQIDPETGEPELDTSKGTTAVHVWRAMIAAAPGTSQQSAAAPGEAT